MSYGLYVQGSFWVWAQPMNGGVTMYHLLSLAKAIPRMIPVMYTTLVVIESADVLVPTGVIPLADMTLNVKLDTIIFYISLSILDVFECVSVDHTKLFKMSDKTSHYLN